MYEQRDWVIEAGDRFYVADDAAMRVIVNRLPQKDLLGIGEVAEALNVNKNVVVAWCDSGRVSFIDLGAGERKQYRKIVRPSLLAFIKSRMG